VAEATAAQARLAARLEARSSRQRQQQQQPPE